MSSFSGVSSKYANVINQHSGCLPEPRLHILLMMGTMCHHGGLREKWWKPPHRLSILHKHPAPSIHWWLPGHRFHTKFELCQRLLWGLKQQCVTNSLFKAACGEEFLLWFLYTEEELQSLTLLKCVKNGGFRELDGLYSRFNESLIQNTDSWIVLELLLKMTICFLYLGFNYTMLNNAIILYSFWKMTLCRKLGNIEMRILQ